jgi:glycerol uptake facilitator-like aquaporin
MSLSRKKIAMVMAEFLGTGLLTLAVLAVSKSTIGIPYFVSIAAGLAVAAGAMAFGNVSGAHFNPIITLGLWSVRRVKTLPAVVYVAAQLLGGIAAYYLFTYFVNQTWNNAGQFEGRVLVAEAVGGFIFALGWAATVYQKLEAGKAVAVVSISLMLAVLISAAGAGGIVNPAVALGVHSWVWGSYVLGPILGAVIGFNLYSLLFAPTAALIADERAAEKAATKSSKKK